MNGLGAGDITHTGTGMVVLRLGGGEDDSVNREEDGLILKIC
jgi:hypothetical protein